MISKLLILLSILLVLLLGRLWLGNGSFIDIWHMQEQIKQMTVINEQKKAKNRMLEAEINEFKSGDEAVIERARTEFGMIKRGETFYQVILKPIELETETIPKNDF